jgi:adenylate kinase family enzyme
MTLKLNSVRLAHMKNIIILTGPGGAGKSTIAEMIEKECGYVLLDGDNEDSDFFPDGGQWLPENSNKLDQAHDKIISKTKKLVQSGNKVVVDYIVFGHYKEFFDKFRKAFREDLHIAVLFPKQSEIVIRDKERECWTTGVDRIKAVYCEFKKHRDEIGVKNYIDTSGQTPKETFEKYFKCSATDSPQS